MPPSGNDDAPSKRLTPRVVSVVTSQTRRASSGHHRAFESHDSGTSAFQHLGEDAVRGMLHLAIFERRKVAVLIHSSTGRGERLLEGVATEIVAGPDGRERLFLEVVAGETMQVVLLERVHSVRIAE